MLNFNELFGPLFGSQLPELIFEATKEDKVAQSLLPTIEITPKIQDKINKGYLDFIVGSFFLIRKNKEQCSVWFLEEIAAYLLKNNPDLGFRQLQFSSGICGQK